MPLRRTDENDFVPDLERSQIGRLHRLQTAPVDLEQRHVHGRIQVDEALDRSPAAVAELSFCAHDAFHDVRVRDDRRHAIFHPDDDARAGTCAFRTAVHDDPDYAGSHPVVQDMSR